MLEVFVEGYALAEAQLAGMQNKDQKKQPEEHDPNQQSLFL